ncbi:MAG: hypothetical protein LBK01_08560 [Burkholderiaceae bacterium]|nr:hypothetical protein [Burkholderiaceae bacterium]
MASCPGDCNAPVDKPQRGALLLLVRQSYPGAGTRMGRRRIPPKFPKSMERIEPSLSCPGNVVNVVVSSKMSLLAAIQIRCIAIWMKVL